MNIVKEAKGQPKSSAANVVAATEESPCLILFFSMQSVFDLISTFSPNKRKYENGVIRKRVLESEARRKERNNRKMFHALGKQNPKNETNQKCKTTFTGD